MFSQFNGRVILFILCFWTCTALNYYQTIFKNPSFDDLICSDSDQIAVSEGHEWTSQCLYSCVRDTSCLSVFYKNGTGSCTRCKAIYTSVQTLSENIGTTYFAKDTKVYGERCLERDICGGTNQVCWTDTCICQIGYSYRNATGACVEQCGTYGSSFQRYPNRRISGHNIDVEYGLTLEECWQACIDYQAHTCISLEYDQERMKCNLAKESALTVPDSVGNIGYFDFYTRNCG